MRLVDSSDPGAVDRWAAQDLILERLVLATSVCRELEECGDNYAESRPRVALRLLREWVGAHYPSGDVEVYASDGLDVMVVPSGSEDLMRVLRNATWVCGDLAFLWTADLRSKYEQDSKKLAEALAGWQRTRSAIRDGNEPKR